MADARRMGKMELFAHFAEKFDMKRTQVRDLFDELNRLSEKELKRSGEFVLPGMCKLVVQKRKAREGRNPATGEPIFLIFAASALIALSSASGPSKIAPVIWPRSAILHKAAASSVDGTSGLAKTFVSRK